MELQVACAAIVVDPPSHRWEVERDTAALGDAESVAAQTVIELLGRDELAPVVRATRQPSQDIFGADDGLDERAYGAIERADHEDAAGCGQTRQRGEERRQIGNV